MLVLLSKSLQSVEDDELDVVVGFLRGELDEARCRSYAIVSFQDNEN